MVTNLKSLALYSNNKLLMRKKNNNNYVIIKTVNNYH